MKKKTAMTTTISKTEISKKSKSKTVKSTPKILYQLDRFTEVYLPKKEEENTIGTLDHDVYLNFHQAEIRVEFPTKGLLSRPQLVILNVNKYSSSSDSDLYFDNLTQVKDYLSNLLEFVKQLEQNKHIACARG